MALKKIHKFISGKKDRKQQNTNSNLEKTQTRKLVSQSEGSVINTNDYDNSGRFYHMYGMGINSWGQLCLNNTESPVIKLTISYPLIASKVKQVAIGWQHTIVLTEGNTIYQVGSRTATVSEKDLFEPKPLSIMQGGDIVKIACGESHSVALNDKGDLYTWGSNFFGQLGLGNRIDNEMPTLVTALSNEHVVDVVAGAKFSLCRTNDGKVFSWGDGSSGALGHDSRDDEVAPRQIEELRGVDLSFMDAGDYHVIAVANNDKNDASVISWGWNGCGQLGVSDFKDRLVPTKSSFSVRGKVKGVSCGSAHSAMISEVSKLDTTCLLMWGSNLTGQLGISIDIERGKYSCPTSVPLKEPPRKVICGANHTIVMCKDGRFLASGYNLNGQTGILKLVSRDSQSYYGLLDNSMVKRSFDSRVVEDTNSIKESTFYESSEKITELAAPILFKDEFTEVKQFKKRKIKEIVCGGNITIALVEKEWLNDESSNQCMGKFDSSCKGKFGVVNRRHHCRKCGGIFCSPCSNHYVCVDSNNMLRFCTKCFQRRKKK